MQNKESQFLNVQQSAVFLGVKVSTIRLWARTHKIKGVKVGSRGDWRFTKDELSKMIQVEGKKFANIKKFLREHAKEIQDLAHRNHLVHLGKDNVREVYIEKNKEDFIEVIHEVADNLENLKKGTIVFERLAERIAKNSVESGLTLEEAVDGTIFLKQAFWQKLDEKDLLHSLSIKDFYSFNHVITTYSDIVAAKIAFAYHDYFSTQVANYLKLSQEHEEKDRITKERLDLAIKAGNIGIYEWDMKTNTIIWTPELEELYGFPPGGFNGKYETALKANHPIDAEATAQKIQETIEKKRDLDLEYRVIWPNRSVHWLSAKGKTEYDKNGKPQRMIGVVTDITTRKQAEESLYMSEARYKTLANFAPVGIFETDINGDCVYVNKRWCELSGLSPKQAYGQGWAKALHPDDKERVFCEWYEAVKRHQGFVSQYRFKSAKGKVSWLYGSGITIETNGKLTGYIGAIVDITDQKTSEDSLRQSEERFRALTTATSDVIYRMSSDWKVMRELQGREFLSDTGKPNRYWLKKYIPHKDQAPVLEGINKAIRSKGIYELEHQVIQIDGTLGWTLSRAIPILDENENIVEWFGTLSNITEQKEAAEKDRYLATLTRNMIDAVISTDKENNIVTWNKGAEKMYGWKAEEVIGKKSGFLNTDSPLHPEKFKSWQDTFGKLGFWQGEVVQQRKDGSKIQVLASVASIKDDKGNIVGGVAVNRDITEKKELERQKDEFLGIASHELKTPVTSIKAYAQVLNTLFKRKGDLTSAEYLEKMDNQIDKLSNLIGDLLDVTKIQAGKIQFNEEYFDLNILINETVEEIQRTTEKHKIITELGSTKTIYGDKERIEQVLINLLSNAIKYSPKSHKIIIKTLVDTSMIIISVQDFGVGISKDKQVHLFEQFYRVSGPNQNTFPGLGLGLYISNEIVKRQGGRIWVDSERGKGSTFFFSLPIHVNTKKIPT
jgi:PAS domain S-box-containing protein